VAVEKADSDHENIDYSSSTDEETEQPQPQSNKFKKSFNIDPKMMMMKHHHDDMYGSLEGPINPVNYTGTQLNVFGPMPILAGSDLANFFQRKQKPEPNVGFLTDQMIKV